jgi:hypothetical protein
METPNEEVKGAIVDYDGSSDYHPEHYPEHQPRDHAVRCIKLCGRETWNHNAICDGCSEG